jgi:hypothetical protein
MEPALLVRDTLPRLLAAAIAAADTSLVLDANYGSLPASDFELQVGAEIIAVGARSGATCSTLTRGSAGTTAVPHNRGDGVVFGVSGETAAAGGNGGGGSSAAVGCVIGGIDLTVADLTMTGATTITWNVIWDDSWNFNVLPDLPDGMGLTIDLGTGIVTATESGIWLFHVACEFRLADALMPDTTLELNLGVGDGIGTQHFGPGLPHNQRIGYGEPQILPAGATNLALVDVLTAATQAASAVNPEMFIVRIG